MYKCKKNKEEKSEPLCSSENLMCVITFMECLEILQSVSTLSVSIKTSLKDPLCTIDFFFFNCISFETTEENSYYNET